MRLWARTRNLSILLLASCVTAAALHGLLLFDVVDLWQLAALFPAVLLAWSLRARDHVTERQALRRTGALDAGLLLLAAASSAGILAILLLLSGRLQIGLFVCWNVIFSLGVCAALMRWLPPAAAAGGAAGISLALYVARYVLGPRWALIHQESPPATALGLAAVVLAVGVLALAIRRND